MEKYNSTPGARSPRSRFNFSNNRLGSPGESVENSPYYNEERESRRELRRQNKAQTKKHTHADLIFSVSQLMHEPEGATRTYQVEADELTLTEDPESVEVARNIKGKTKFTRVRHEILVQGDFEADVTINCVRCLNDFETHVNLNLEDLYRPSIDVVTGLPVPEDETDEGVLLIDQNHILDLGEALRQQVLVSLPMYPVCGDDCKGLYEYVDRANADVPPDEEEPEEEPEPDAPIDKRWAALSKLHLDE
jgi:uncharacterized protein